MNRRPARSSYSFIMQGNTVNPSDQEARKDSIASSDLPVPISLTKPAIPHDPYLAWRFLDFRLLFVGSFIATLGEQMITIAIGWELYERTNSALVLGLVGLVQVVPIFILSLPAGHIADRFNRKRIVIISLLALAVASIGLTVLSYFHGPLLLIYGCLLLMGSATAFNGPASSTLVAQVVPESAYQSAATWSSSSWQLASVIGPALGGIVIAVTRSATLIYGLNAAAMILYALLLLPLHGQQRAVVSTTTTLGSLSEGIKFLWSTQIILASITLDMFAVLLGGATTLLPIFAKDILHVGPVGLGWLRTAPSLGALCITFGIAYVPPFKKAGRTLLWAVGGFGLATIIFGLSHSFWLSLLMLFLLGGLDNISVVIRSTLLLTRTPNAMLGRISSVNTLFIGASNELGGFESGLVAQLFGPIISVVGGGIGTIVVVLLVALLWPDMRRLGKMQDENVSPS
ncbi:MAG: MFS transporter [Ktedonobacteraceae bacterium]